MNSFRIITALLFLTLCPAAFAQDTPAKTPNMPEYETRYYHVYTDIDLAQAKEACIRMTKMAEEYHLRTAGFAGDIRQKMPFYLFKSADEYYEAGGMPKSAGVFNGTKLMAMADPRIGPKETWHVVQHEGFHQFMHAVVGGDIPIWVNEGMAEYFGESIFTGDGFVTGVIPPWRLARLKKEMAATGENKFRSIDEMMKFSHAEWNAEMKIENYDQAWSMVHFLAHGDDGKYQDAFVNYMKLVSHGRQSDTAWKIVFGNDSAGFERQWKAWWNNLSDNPTSELYARATVATLTSFLSRAVDQKQTFDNFDEFIRDADGETLKCGDNEWLPPSLLKTTLRDVAHRVDTGDTFILSLGKNNRLPSIVDQTSEGLKVDGEGKIGDGRVSQVTVTITGKKNPSAVPTASGDTQRTTNEPPKE